jgi:CMP-N,N'-diacetyllegionaminic acid synthase
VSTPRTLAVIAARGGSKGIPNKNLIDLCGKPLLAWSIEQALAAPEICEVAVSSDSDAILAVAEKFGAVGVRRPADIAGDLATSESAWLHALNAREAASGAFERVVALQVTSPVREGSDISAALTMYQRDGFDSILSVCEIEDFFNWKLFPDGSADAVNYDWRNRRRRQEIEKRYLENGSFYVFAPEMLRKTGNRLGGRIGLHIMERHKMFQIDRPDEVQLCAAIMKGYGYA